jgi:hypothetical protein
MSTPKKRLLIAKASNDVCVSELNHVRAIAQMLGIEVCTVSFASLAEFDATVSSLGKFNFIYLCAHASVDGFGEAGGGETITWEDFASSICSLGFLDTSALVFLACCRGGFAGIARRLFFTCGQIDYVCGPRWQARPSDLVLGFHALMYNLECRREQPTVAATRASAATGYEFFCYDRVEVEEAEQRSQIKLSLNDAYKLLQMLKEIEQVEEQGI